MSSCQYCKYWKQHQHATDETVTRYGDCWKYAPRPVVGMMNKSRLRDTNVQWPITTFNDVCGEFQRNFEIGEKSKNL